MLFLSGFELYSRWVPPFIPVILCGFAVFEPSGLRPPLFRLLSDLKFYYIHVKVSILKPILVF